MTLRENSEHFQDTLLTKLLGQFELHSPQFFQRPGNLIRDCIVLFLPTTFEKLGVNLTPENIYMEEEFGIKKHT